MLDAASKMLQQFLKDINLIQIFLIEKLRRKARRAGAPVLICPDGASRAGAYCLIDALITAYANGKEPRPASLLDSLRSQRMKSVRNEAQLNFITEAMAEAAESALTP